MAQRLFRSYYPAHEGFWISLVDDTWFAFPAKAGGWERRHRATGIDPMRLREVPLLQGFNTGMPGTPGDTATAMSATQQE